MQEYFKIEEKSVDRGRALQDPRNYPRDTDLIIGEVFPMVFPRELINPDIAYQMALLATYWYWESNVWNYIGYAESFLRFLVERTRKEGYVDWIISWPEPFPNHYTFNRPEIVQVRPLNELLRRHFDQDAYVADRDVIIETTFRRRRIYG